MPTPDLVERKFAAGERRAKQHATGPLGQTTLQVSAIAFGTWALHEQAQAVATKWTAGRR